MGTLPLGLAGGGSENSDLDLPVSNVAPVVVPAGGGGANRGDGDPN